MKSAIMALMAIVCIAFTGNAIAGNGHGNGSAKAKVCHNGHTLNVSVHAVPAHMNHGDTNGSCGVVSEDPPINHPPVVVHPPVNEVPVTADTFRQVNRILACADRAVLRIRDNTMGISIDLDLGTFVLARYLGASFTVAHWYAGIGATCDPLGGSFSGRFQDGYPVWVR